MAETQECHPVDCGCTFSKGAQAVTHLRVRKTVRQLQHREDVTIETQMRSSGRRSPALHATTVDFGAKMPVCRVTTTKLLSTTTTKKDHKCATKEEQNQQNAPGMYWAFFPPSTFATSSCPAKATTYAVALRDKSPSAAR